MSSRTKRGAKLVLFSLLPAVVLFLGAEIVVRVTGLDAASLKTRPLPEESAGLFRADPELFWSLRPNLTTGFRGAPVTTNGLGLRSPEISTKQPNEFRILSLGESSTFGVGVSTASTYTALLAGLLKQQAPYRPVTAINAGVSAYSSFQSLTYLEQRGLELQPDLILFYHEVNDYLPSSLRDSSHNEIGVLKTDKQLYESRVQRAHRTMIRVSALYRFFSRRQAYRRIRSFDSTGMLNPVLEIGLPDIAIGPRLEPAGESADTDAGLKENMLGRRVSDDERLEILERLVALARGENIELILIHPTYRYTERHECLLTRFCARTGASMFEAYDALHPPDGEEGGLFLDTMHPNKEGHLRLARDLAHFVVAQGILEDGP